MSPRPIVRSSDLRQLRSEGYTLRIAGGYLVVDDVPYVDRDGIVHDDGALVMALTLTGDETEAPADHTAYFMGGVPCDAAGSPLDRIINNMNRTDLGNELIAACYFSAKPVVGAYTDFHQKVTTYVGLVSAYATAIDPSVTPRRHRPLAPDDDCDGPFHYVDTATARAGLGQLAEKLAFERLGIVGLGGTGAYVLDIVAKTPVAQIHAFDGDPFLTHNAFRAPGAPTIEQLDERPLKVEHLAETYRRMHRGIVVHPYALDASNADQLSGLTFVFIAIDDAPAKAPIIAKLLELAIPFVDLGMGVELVDEHLTGIVRATLVTPERHDHVASCIPTTEVPGPDDYRSNIQIAELNALNAVAGVMLWKKLRGIYADLDGAMQSMYSISSNHIVLSVDGHRADDDVDQAGEGWQAA